MTLRRTVIKNLAGQKNPTFIALYIAGWAYCAVRHILLNRYSISQYNIHTVTLQHTQYHRERFKPENASHQLGALCNTAHPTDKNETSVLHVLLLGIKYKTIERCKNLINL